MSAFTIDEITTAAGLQAVAGEWGALCDAAPAGPFGIPAVALAWWDHLGRGRPLVVTARDAAGRLVGLAPLHERRLAGLDVVRWLGFGLGAVGEVLTAPGVDDVSVAIWQHLSGSPRRVLQLIEYRHGGQGLDALRRSAAWQVGAELRDACPVVDACGHADVAAFLAEPGRRKLRQNLARYDRQADRDEVALTVGVHTTAEAIEGVVGDLTVIHDTAEEAHPRLHFLAEPWRPFTIDALRRCAAEGRVAAFIVRLGGRPVGLHVVLTTGSTAYAWLARYDPSASAYAPGHIMLRAVVGWAIERGFPTLDLQLGDDPYKLRWSSSTYDTVGVLAAAPGRLTRGRVQLRAVDVAHAAKARLTR